MAGKKWILKKGRVLHLVGARNSKPTSSCRAGGFAAAAASSCLFGAWGVPRTVGMVHLTICHCCTEPQMAAAAMVCGGTEDGECTVLCTCADVVFERWGVPLMIRTEARTIGSGPGPTTGVAIQTVATGRSLAGIKWSPGVKKGWDDAGKVQRRGP